jgi:hypothetical protein
VAGGGVLEDEFGVLGHRHRAAMDEDDGVLVDLQRRLGPGVDQAGQSSSVSAVSAPMRRRWSGPDGRR